MKIITKNLSGILYTIFSSSDEEFLVLGNYSFPDLSKKIGFYIYEKIQEHIPEVKKFKTRRVKAWFYWNDRTEDELELSEVRRKYAMKVLQSSFSRGIEVSDFIVYFLQDFELLRGTSKSPSPEKEGIIVYEEEVKSFLVELLRNRYQNLILSNKVREFPISSVRIFSSKNEIYFGDWESKASVVWNPENTLIYTLPATLIFLDLLDFVEFDYVEVKAQKLTLTLDRESLKRFFNVVNASLLPIVFRPGVVSERDLDLKKLAILRKKVPELGYCYILDQNTDVLRVHFLDDFFLFEEPAKARLPKAFKVVFPVNLKELKIFKKNKSYKVKFIGRFACLNDLLLDETISQIKEENN